MARRMATVLRLARPAGAVPLVVALRRRRALADLAVLADAREQMDFLVGAALPDVDLDELGRRYIEQMLWRAERRWHPKLITGQRIEGLAHVYSARAGGSGVIVNFMHHGYYNGALASLAAAGVPCHVVVDAADLADDAADWVRQHLRVAGMGNTLVGASNGVSGRLAELLRAGDVVALASDVPGSSPATFLGRRRLGSAGTAHLSMLTGSPVVVMTSHPGSDGRPFVRLAEPVWPGDFSSVQDLLVEVLRRHEDAVLAWPEAADLPLDRWLPLLGDGTGSQSATSPNGAGGGSSAPMG